MRIFQQYCAHITAHIINMRIFQQYCSTLSHLIRAQQYCLILLTTLFNPVLSALNIDPKASFPLGRILRAERHFSSKLCNKVERSSTFSVAPAENVAPRAKFRLVENGLQAELIEKKTKKNSAARGKFRLAKSLKQVDNLLPCSLVRRSLHVRF